MIVMELMAGMGELVVSADKADVLACLGLGSCIGLALLDRRAGVAGLLHVMLPEAPSGEVRAPGKYADLGVPALVDRVLAKGAAKHRLEAALVGGARMFATGRDIGSRNERAVREQLADARIVVRAAATGGSCGRSMRVRLDSLEVSCREVAGDEVSLIAGAAR